MANFRGKVYGETQKGEVHVVACTCRGDASQCPRHPPAPTPLEMAAKARHPEVRDRANALAQRIEEFRATGLRGPKLFRAVFGADFYQGPRVHLWTDHGNALHSGEKRDSGQENHARQGK